MNNLHFDLAHLFQSSPENFIAFLFNILTILFILAASYLVLKGWNRVLKAIEARQYISEPIVGIFHSAFKWFVLVSAAILILQQMGIRLNYLWALLSAFAAMVAIGFVAVWSILSNFLCTLMLIVFHPFRIGDEIEIIDPAMTSGISGVVRNINLMFTRLGSIDKDTGTQVVTHIPNNLFFQKILCTKIADNSFGLDRQLFEKNSLLGGKEKPLKK